MLIVSKVDNDRITVVDTKDGVSEEATEKIVKAVGGVVGVDTATNTITALTHEEMIKAQLFLDTILNKQPSLNISGTTIIDARREPYIAEDGTIAYGAPVSDKPLDFIDVKIPYGIDVVGADAFMDSHNMKSIEIPNSVTFIAIAAFHDCRSLTTVSLPDSVEVVDNGAFTNCIRLESIRLSKNLKKLGIYTFANTALKAIDIPSGVTEIPVGICQEVEHLKLVRMANVATIKDNAFFKCTNLKYVEFSDNLRSIEHSAFRFCISLKRIVLPESLCEIGDCAFADCTDLQTVKLPSGILSIGTRAFFNCKSLKRITIPEGIEVAPIECFKGCLNLRRVELPMSMKTVLATTFYGCTALTIRIPNPRTEIPLEFCSFQAKIYDYRGFVFECSPNSIAEKVAKQLGISCVYI